VAQGSSSSIGKALPSWEQLLQGLLLAGESSAHTTKRERKEALPAGTIRPRHLQAGRWQAAGLPKRAEARFSQPRFGTSRVLLLGSVCTDYDH